MKEYICKEDVIELLKALNGKELAESIVNEMPTVTMDDVLKEFFERLEAERTPLYLAPYDDEDLDTKAVMWEDVEQILVEMERLYG